MEKDPSSNIDIEDQKSPMQELENMPSFEEHMKESEEWKPGPHYQALVDAQARIDEKASKSHQHDTAAERAEVFKNGDF